MDFSTFAFQRYYCFSMTLSLAKTKTVLHFHLRRAFNLEKTFLHQTVDGLSTLPRLSAVLTKSMVVHCLLPIMVYRISIWTVLKRLIDHLKKVTCNIFTLPTVPKIVKSLSWSTAVKACWWHRKYISWTKHSHRQFFEFHGWNEEKEENLKIGFITLSSGLYI